MAYVMIVDDDEDFALAVATVLREAGHEVRLELNTSSAVQSMELRQPELAILDVMFPDNSSAGFELARTMRVHNERLRDIPILFLTAVNQRFPLGFSARDVDDTWLPADDFLEKPVSLELLRTRVEALLRNKASASKEPRS